MRVNVNTPCLVMKSAKSSSFVFYISIGRSCREINYVVHRFLTEMIRTRGEKDRGRRSDENMEVGGHGKMGRPKLRWSDVIRKDMKGN